MSQSEEERPFSRNSSLLNRTPLDASSIRSGDYWDELRVFLAVAKFKSFNRAASELGKSSMTISRSVQRLQDILKTELFHAGKQGVQLTAAGYDLAVMASRLDLMVSHFARSIGAEDKEAHGEVRVSVTEGLSTIFIGALIATLTDEHPKITIALQSPRNINDLRQDSADMMLAVHEENAPDVICRRLGTIHFVPMASAEYISRSGLPTLENLSQHRFLMTPMYSADSQIWSKWHKLAQNGKQSHSSEASIPYFLLVKSGFGIGLLASYATTEPLLKPLDIGFKISIPLYGMALAESMNQAPKRIVFEWLCRVFSEENPWFQEEASFNHPASEFDQSFRFLFNIR